MELGNIKGYYCSLYKMKCLFELLAKDNSVPNFN